jgi:hypothetical protein
MSNLDLDTLNKLENLRVSLYVSIPAPGGQYDYKTTAAEIPILEEDPEKFYAQAYGLTVEQFRDWHDNGCSILCSATTKAGNRCTNFVRRGFQVSASEYLARNGETCASHGG